MVSPSRTLPSQCGPPTAPQVCGWAGIRTLDGRPGRVEGRGPASPPAPASLCSPPVTLISIAPNSGAPPSAPCQPAGKLPSSPTGALYGLDSPALKAAGNSPNPPRPELVKKKKKKDEKSGQHNRHNCQAGKATSRRRSSFYKAKPRPRADHAPRRAPPSDARMHALTRGSSGPGMRTRAVGRFSWTGKREGQGEPRPRGGPAP